MLSLVLKPNKGREYTYMETKIMGKDNKGYVTKGFTKRNICKLQTSTNLLSSQQSPFAPFPTKTPIKPTKGMEHEWTKIVGQGIRPVSYRVVRHVTESSSDIEVFQVDHICRVLYQFLPNINLKENDNKLGTSRSNIFNCK